MYSQRRSIKEKLFQLLVGTTFLALVTACAAFIYTDRLNSAEQKQNAAIVLLDAIAGSTIGPLAFEDADSAYTVLSTLDSETTARTAILYKSDGEPLAAWHPYNVKTSDDHSSIDTQELHKRIKQYEPNIFFPNLLIVQRSILNEEGHLIGALHVEFATNDLEKRTSQFLIIASIVLAICITSTMVVSSLFSRTISDPITELVEASRRIQQTGDYKIRVHEDRLLELGILADNFNNMLKSIQARDAILEDRSMQLRVNNDAIRVVLDSIEQGLLTIDINGFLLSERSAVATQLLEDLVDGDYIADYLFKDNPEAKEWFELGLESIQEDILPIDVSLSQLPSHLVLNQRNLYIQYKPIYDGNYLAKILVILSDVTTELQASAMERAQKDILAAFGFLVKDPYFFQIFLEEAHAIVMELDSSSHTLEQKKRKIHTLKGNCSLYGMKNFAEHLHALEGDLERDARDLTIKEIQRVKIKWDPIISQMNVLLGQTHKTEEIAITLYEQKELLHLADNICPNTELQQRLKVLPFDKISRSLNQIADKARPVARKLGKEDLVFEIEDGDVRISTAKWQPFWSVFIHVVNNAIDHGIEDRELRVKNGKPSHGTLKLKAIPQNNGCKLEVSDDGQGINWEKLKKMGQKLGMPNQSYDDLTKILYADGLSTKKEASIVSGRGVGLGAVAEVCENMSIKYSVRSEPNQGTTFCFELPGPLI